MKSFGKHIYSRLCNKSPAVCDRNTSGAFILISILIIKYSIVVVVLTVNLGASGFD